VPPFGTHPEDGETTDLLTLATQARANKKLLSIHFMFYIQVFRFQWGLHHLIKVCSNILEEHWTKSLLQNAKIPRKDQHWLNTFRVSYCNI
jgi:hypothetical protein